MLLDIGSLRDGAEPPRHSEQSMPSVDFNGLEKFPYFFDSLAERPPPHGSRRVSLKRAATLRRGRFPLKTWRALSTPRDVNHVDGSLKVRRGFDLANKPPSPFGPLLPFHPRCTVAHLPPLRGPRHGAVSRREAPPPPSAPHPLPFTAELV